MSEAILIHGKRGSGKTLVAIYLIQKYLIKNRLVATNIDLYIDKLLSPLSKSIVIRLPDHPSVFDLSKVIPLGNPSLYWDGDEILSDDQFSESNNGLLVLDEVATFLNSRNWQREGRSELISWLAQSRKYGWDLLFLAQHPRMLDAQIRDSLIEVQGSARRLDKVMVPLIGNFWKYMTGEMLHFPKIHIVGLFYGFQQNAPLWDRYIFKGCDLYHAYNTRQVINPETGNKETFSYLSPWHVVGRYMNGFDLYKKAIIAALLIGLVVGFPSGYFFHGLNNDKSIVKPVSDKVSETVTVTGVIKQSGQSQLLLSDGKLVIATSYKADLNGERYLVNDVWYKVQK